MSIICKIFKHKWGYNYIFRKEIELGSVNLQPDPIRICSICKKEEYGEWDYKTGEFIFRPSILELREIKLNKLGIK